MTDVLLSERRDDVVLLTINRPEKRNALNLELVNTFHRVLKKLDRDRSLRAVVLTGAGDHFLAGVDIAELRDRRAPEALEAINGRLFRRLEELCVPVIAAVRGFVVGGGCELAMACDLRVAGRSARFGQPEVGLGIIPGAGGTYRLPRLVGMGRAKDLIYTGRILDAEEALSIGLVDRVVDDDRLVEEAMTLAGDVARQDPTAVRLAKLALNAQGMGTDIGYRLEKLAQAVLFESEEKDRRMTEFLDRRLPRKETEDR